MKLQDLENGMIVTLKYGNECLLMDNKLISNNFRMYSKLDYYNENLTCRLNEQDNIMKVQSFNKVDTLWERKEIDWSKVAFGTKVRVWNDNKENTLEGKFISYDKEYNNEYPFFIFISNEEDVRWKYCELIENVEDQDTPTSEEIDNGHTEHCNQQDGCRECKYKSERCVSDYILENYNVTKK